MGMVAWVFYFWVPTGDRVFEFSRAPAARDDALMINDINLRHGHTRHAAQTQLNTRTPNFPPSQPTPMQSP
jgi:hypothetical protein